MKKICDFCRHQYKESMGEFACANRDYESNSAMCVHDEERLNDHFNPRLNDINAQDERKKLALSLGKNEAELAELRHSLAAMTRLLNKKFNGDGE